ncbi:hypothetical protein GCM10010304_17390 [Streptomyces roseoviolaceus]
MPTANGPRGPRRSDHCPASTIPNRLVVTFSAVNGRACLLGRSHLVALPTVPYDGTVTGRISRVPDVPVAGRAW